MTNEEAKAIFLLEHCAERCEGYQNDDACDNCEINIAIEALEKQVPKKPIEIDWSYEVLIDNLVIATKMSLENATILLKALFMEYYNDHFMVVSIREMERCKAECCDDMKAEMVADWSK